MCLVIEHLALPAYPILGRTAVQPSPPHPHNKVVHAADYPVLGIAATAQPHYLCKRQTKRWKMKTYKKMITAALGAIAMLPLPAQAQLKVGGYGEVALSRNFYSDNVFCFFFFY